MTKFISKNRNKIALLLSIILVGTAVVGGTLAYIITKTPSLLNTFITEHSSNLIISKTVEHPFGDSYTLPEDMEFEFTVNLGENYKNEKVTVQTSATENSEKTADENGCFDLTLKPGQSVKILDILDGTEVSVTEKPNEDYSAGFSVKEDDYTSENDDNTKTIIIKRGDNKLEFVNVYEPAPVPADELFAVGGKKVFEVPEDDWQTDENSYTFNFGLEYTLTTADGETERVVLSGEAVPSVTYYVITEVSPDDAEDSKKILQGGNTAEFDFNALLLGEDGNSIFDEPGTYSFRASETMGDDSNIAYDMNLYTFDVEVTDEDMDGVLEIKSVKGYDGVTVQDDSVGMTFTNEYHQGGSDSVRIDITKVVESDAGEKSPAGYEFALYEYDENEEKWVEVEKATSNQEGKAYISLTYYADELEDYEFNYTLKEVIPDEEDREPGITYDDSEWSITVTIEDNDDGTDIDAKVEAEKIEKEEIADQTAAAAVFYEEVIEPDTAPQDDIPVVEEETEEQEETTEEGTSGDIPEISAIGVSAGTAKTKSSFAITSAAADTSNVNEVDALQPDSGGRQFEWHEAESDNICQVTFTNVYVPAPASGIEISGTKTLEGRDLVAEEFEFGLYAKDEDGDLELIESVKNSEEGAFEFVSLSEEGTYKKIDTYEYVIKEIDGELGGIAYDLTEFYVTVTVEDNNGALTAETVIEDEYGNVVENGEIAFTNTYEAAPATVTLTAKKELSGADLTAGRFNFLLYAVDENMVKQGDVVDEALNGEDGSITFDELKFTEVGEYYYVVEEEQGNDAGITYDDTVYEATVTVTDNGEGQLVAETAIVERGANGSETEMVFENAYDPAVTPSPTPDPGESDDPTTTPKPTPTPGDDIWIPVVPDDDDDDGSGVPPTGDNNNIGLYVTIMLASIAAIAALLVVGKQQKKSGRKRKHS